MGALGGDFAATVLVRVEESLFVDVLVFFVRAGAIILVSAKERTDRAVYQCCCEVML